MAIEQVAREGDNDNVISSYGRFRQGGAMLRFNRSTDLRDAGKPGLKPALYEPPGSLGRPAAGATARPAPPPVTPARESTAAPAASPREQTPAPIATAPAPAIPTLDPTEAQGSRLFIGVNIKLKGVEISDCDVLVIEGHVEATAHSKMMQIDKPGTLKGTALIDVAEIHGDFSGELTARTRLVVHGTGRVSGTIRYGKLIVAEGGELSGDVKRLDAADEPPQRSLLPGVRGQATNFIAAE
jgi:cytoskeletal protein CcmA (bactofilin family)